MKLTLEVLNGMINGVEKMIEESKETIRNYKGSVFDLYNEVEHLKQLENRLNSYVHMKKYFDFELGGELING